MNDTPNKIGQVWETHVKTLLAKPDDNRHEDILGTKALASLVIALMTTHPDHGGVKTALAQLVSERSSELQAQVAARAISQEAMQQEIAQMQAAQQWLDRLDSVQK